MIAFGCPSCSKSFQLQDEYAGRRATCPECGEAIRVPVMKDAPIQIGGRSPLPPLQGKPVDPAPSGSNSKRLIKRAPMWMGLCAGGLIVATIGAILGRPDFYFNARNGKHADSQASKGDERRSSRDDGWSANLGLESRIIKRIGDVDVIVGYRLSTVYVPRNAGNITEANMPLTFGIFFPVAYRNSGGPFTAHTAGFIPINGRPHKLEYTSSNRSVAEVYDDGSAVFRGGGEAVITVQVAGQSIYVPLTVVELPINASRSPNSATSAGEVVRQLGLPDDKTKHYIAWPESKEIDGILYSPSGGGGIATEHWRYKRYPGAVIAIVGTSANGWVWCVGTHKGN